MAKYLVTVIETRTIDLAVEADDAKVAEEVAWELSWVYDDWDTSDCSVEVNELQEFANGVHVINA